jgi:NNP family nitrate/nitrite transporter-like MFS transporter
VTNHAIGRSLIGNSSFLPSGHSHRTGELETPVTDLKAAPRSDVAPAGPARRGWISDWDPEDPGFWARTGRRVAWRNLVFSIFVENLGFSIWSLWSIVVVSLKAAGFPFGDGSLFLLVAIPPFTGALLRIPYTLAVPRFGGRNWTIVSGLMLLAPVSLLAWAVTDKTTPYWVFVVAAALAGLGGGNFSSSMANISFFFPERDKGLALGLNAAGGNIGVAFAQLFVPMVLATGVVGTALTTKAGPVFLQNAGLVWVPLILAASLCAWLFMDNLSVASAGLRAQLVVARHRQTWIMSVVYIGTFGSFIGYSAAFPLLIKVQFPTAAVGGFVGVKLAFFGALVGSLARPAGGWLADRLGGARVTLWVFGGTALGVIGVLSALSKGSFGLFFGSFIGLFVMTGLGNGSVYRMIPAIWRSQALAGVDEADSAAVRSALGRARTEGAAVLGFVGAVGALGGALIPVTFKIAGTAAVSGAFVTFLAFYVVCAGLTWWCYLRRTLFTAQLPSLAHAGI